MLLLQAQKIGSRGFIYMEVRHADFGMSPAVANAIKNPSTNLSLPDSGVAPLD